MEQFSAKALVMSSCRALLQPIARLLLKSGVTWKEFAELSRHTFVDVATREFGLRGRPTNVSRVAILTGLARREVRRQQQAASAEPQSSAGYMSKASRVLSGWHQDPEFLDSDGHARILTLDGEGASFAELVRRYGGGDIPAGALLKELQLARAIERRADDTVRALTRVYLPRRMDEGQIRLWGSVLQDVGTTLEHNLTRDVRTAPRFERRALSVLADKRALPAFRQFLEQEGQAFLERMDDWLTAHQVNDDKKGEAIRLGAGLYHIEDTRVRGRSK
jgi:Family of unknown function (DUF6502)